jgi:hypothetical protein
MPFYNFSSCSRTILFRTKNQARPLSRRHVPGKR